MRAGRFQDPGMFGGTQKIKVPGYKLLSRKISNIPSKYQ